MKLSKEEFRTLRAYWYNLIAESGFQDVEELKGDDLVLKQTASYCYRATTELSRHMKEEYFRCLSQNALDEFTVYRNHIDKHILIRYSEGAKIKTIVQELDELGLSRDRKSIKFIIRRYEKAWGIRHYEAHELNNIKKVKS